MFRIMENDVARRGTGEDQTGDVLITVTAESASGKTSRDNEAITRE